MILRRGVALALLLAGCDRRAPEPAATAPAPAPSAPLEAAGVRYLERWTGGAIAGEKVPLVIAIHGLGDDPVSFVQIFASFGAKARVVVPYGERWGEGYAWFPTGLFRDPARLTEATTGAADRIAAMIAALVKAQPPAGKPIVTGFSQGGILSFTLAALHPEVVGAAFPVSGLLAPGVVPKASARAEIVAFHGIADERVPVARGREAVDRLKAAGLDARLVEYAGVGHAIPPPMRAELLAALGDAVSRAAR